MDAILEMRYLLDESLSIILAVMSIALSLVALAPFVKSEKKQKHVGLYLFIMAAFGTTILLLVNHNEMKNYCSVPGVTDITYQMAVYELNQFELKAEGQSGYTPLSLDTYVVEQIPQRNTIVEKGATVFLKVTKTEGGEESVDEEFIAPNSILDDTQPDLSIVIDSFSLFDTGFYYSEPNEEQNTYWVIDFDKGLSGSFHYSRALTDREKNNWFHGGTLYYLRGEDRIDVYTLGYNVSIWSDDDGLFAIRFPDNLPPGDYVFVLHQVIDGSLIEAPPLSFSFNGYK